MDVHSLPKSQKIVASMVMELFGTDREKRERALTALSFAFEGKVALAQQRLKAYFGKAEIAKISTICRGQFVAI